MPDDAIRKRDSIGISPDMLDSAGTVKIYDTVAKCWCRRSAIDAREMIAMDTGSLDEPKSEKKAAATKSRSEPVSGLGAPSKKEGDKGK